MAHSGLSPHINNTRVLDPAPTWRAHTPRRHGGDRRRRPLHMAETAQTQACERCSSPAAERAATGDSPASCAPGSTGHGDGIPTKRQCRLIGGLIGSGMQWRTPRSHQKAKSRTPEGSSRYTDPNRLGLDPKRSSEFCQRRGTWRRRKGSGETRRFQLLSQVRHVNEKRSD